jgi:hypothetical protein
VTNIDPPSGVSHGAVGCGKFAGSATSIAGDGTVVDVAAGASVVDGTTLVDDADTVVEAALVVDGSVTGLPSLELEHAATSMRAETPTRRERIAFPQAS